MNILPKLGLMRLSTHSTEIASYATDLKRANEARDNWRTTAKELEGENETLVKLARMLTEERDIVRSERNKAWAEIAELNDMFATLRPLAEATLKRRANDAKRVRPSRGKVGK